MRPLPLLCALVLVLSSAAAAQTLTESLEVSIIEVPVTVHDRGAAVRGLTKENFQVFVDGKPVPVEYFDVVDLTKITDGRQPAPAVAYRNFLLLFDVANSAPGTIGRAKEAATTFVQTQIGERDLAAVATYTTQNGARMITSFTRDQSLLLAAISTLGEAKHFKSMDPLRIAPPHENVNPGENHLEDKPREAALSAAGKEQVEFSLQQEVLHDRQTLERIKTQIENYGSVARALDALRGQKQIILLSEGFDGELLTGKEDLSFQNVRRENAMVEKGEIWTVDSDQRFGGAHEMGSVGRMAELFRRSDVRLHAIDIKGLRGSIDVAEGAKKTGNDSLFLITRPTGGDVLRHGNNLSAQFDQLLRRQEVIYVLGIKPRDAKPGQFHPLRVKLTGAKGEVSHRAGYYDKDGGMNELEATVRLAELITNSTEVRDLPLALTALPVPGEGEDARVPVIVDASGPELLAGIDAPAANANLFVYAFDQNGRVADFQQQRISLDLAKAGPAVRETGVRYLASLLLKPGRYDVKALVRVDETGRIGLTTRSVEVPRFGEAAVLPPVALRDIGRWVTVISRGTGAEATEVLSLGERRFVPGARAELSADVEQEIALLLRGVAVEDLSVSPALVNKDGGRVPVSLQLAGRTEPDPFGLAKVLFRVAAPRVAAGEYELRLDVAPKGGAAVAVTLPVVVR